MQFERSFLEKSAEANFTGKCIPVNLGFLEKSPETSLGQRWSDRTFTLGRSFIEGSQVSVEIPCNLSVASWRSRPRRFSRESASRSTPFLVWDVDADISYFASMYIYIYTCIGLHVHPHVSLHLHVHLHAHVQTHLHIYIISTFRIMCGMCMYMYIII